jgi:hypothetical protein
VASAPSAGSAKADTLSDSISILAKERHGHPSVISRSESDRAIGKQTSGGWGIKALQELSLAIAIYGMAGWIYVMICSLAAPNTLALPLTHLLPWLREDTSGVISFILSFIGFVTYRVIRSD